MSAQGIPSDPGNSWSSSALHSYAPEIGFGTFSQTADEKADDYVRQVQQTMDMEKRRLLIQEAARYRQEQVLGGISLYQPMTTMPGASGSISHPGPIPATGISSNSSISPIR
jgi:ABC-type transport system substrate-binding protein